MSQINVGDGVLRDEVVRTGLDSAARLVMADNTNLSLGPNATVKLDRTVFNDEHTYRDIAIRLTTGAFRFVTGTFGEGRLQDHHVAGDDRRARHHPRYPVAAGQDDRGAAGRRLARLRHRRSSALELTHPGDTAVITLTGGKVTIQKTQHPAMDLRRDLRGRGGTLHRHAICRCYASGRQSMTAAIPPACCAGADHDEIPAHRIIASGRACRGGLACAHCGANASGGRAISDTRRPRRRRHRRQARHRFQRQPALIPARGSIDGLANQRFNQMITNRVLGTVLLGVNEQVNCSDCISAFGSAGSFSAGIHGRKEITSNLSLLAGIAYTQYSEGGYSVTSAPIGAFALRYDFTDWGSSRPFFDVGTILSPFEKVRYSRGYTYQPRRRFAGQLDRQQRLRRVRKGGLDQPIFAARRGRGVGRGLADVAAR